MNVYVHSVSHIIVTGPAFLVPTSFCTTFRRSSQQDLHSYVTLEDLDITFLLCTFVYNLAIDFVPASIFFFDSCVNFAVDHICLVHKTSVFQAETLQEMLQTQYILFKLAVGLAT